MCLNASQGDGDRAQDGGGEWRAGMPSGNGTPGPKGEGKQPAPMRRGRRKTSKERQSL